MNPTNKASRRTAPGVVLSFLALCLALACAGAGGSGSGSGAAPTPRTAAAEARVSYQSVAIQVLRRMGDGKESEVAKLERPLSALAALPISFVSRQVAGGEGAPGTWEQRLEVGAEKVAVPKQTWSCKTPAGCLAKQWLRFELRGPGAPRVVERVLYERTAPDDPALPGYGRHTITILTDAVKRAEVSQRIQQQSSALRVEERKNKVDALGNDARPEALGQLDALDVGSTLGHLLALAFAAESDALTARLAATMGVTVGRETPRIFITSVESAGADGNGTLSLDLLLDEVRAEVADPAVARLFQLARGIEESSLEARLLEHLVGEGSGVSTARLLAEARGQGVELLVISSANRQQIAALGAPPRFAALLDSAVEQGHHVVVPKSAVGLAGRQRWGFWRIQPESGMTIGVMEGGQHQGMTDFTRTTREVAFDPKKAFLIGLHAGMIQSQFGFAALMLKYGEVTPVLIQELKDMLKDQGCSACPQASAGVEVAIKVGEDCIKKELFSKKKELAFCDAYNNGFKCAVGMLLASLKGENQLPVKVEAEAKIQLGCTEEKLGGGG